MAKLVKQSGRQSKLTALINLYGKTAVALAALPDSTPGGVYFAPADSGVSIAAIDLPVGAIITDMVLYVDTAFDAGATDTLSIGDAGSASRYASAVSIHSTGIISLATKTYYEVTPTNSTIKLVWTGGTPASLSTGIARLFIEYIVKDRAQVSCG